MAERMTTAPHPRLACDCTACKEAPDREVVVSSVARPIAKGEGITRLVERCMSFNDKERMARALMMCGQTGVAVADGLQMGVYMLEVMLRLDPNKGMLNVDIQNMFNTLCRVSLMEDIMDSEEILGVDFTHLAAYINMTYGKESALWFKIDAAEEGSEFGLAERNRTAPGAHTKVRRKTEWARLASELGVHQGRPLSCFLAAVGLVKCLQAAQKAIDDFNGVDRFPEGVSDEEKAAAWELAEGYGAVSAYLDDASFLASVQALCVAYDAYTSVAQRRCWRCVEKKSRIAAGHYHHEGQPGAGEADADFSCGDRVEAGVQRFPGVQSASPPQQPDAGTTADDAPNGSVAEGDQMLLEEGDGQTRPQCVTEAAVSEVVSEMVGQVVGAAEEEAEVAEAIAMSLEEEADKAKSLRTLTEMGFSHSSAQHALLVAGEQSVTAALDWLLAHRSHRHSSPPPSKASCRLHCGPLPAQHHHPSTASPSAASESWFRARTSQPARPTPSSTRPIPSPSRWATPASQACCAGSAVREVSPRTESAASRRSGSRRTG